MAGRTAGNRERGAVRQEVGSPICHDVPSEQVTEAQVKGHSHGVRDLRPVTSDLTIGYVAAISC